MGIQRPEVITISKEHSSSETYHERRLDLQKMPYRAKRRNENLSKMRYTISNFCRSAPNKKRKRWSEKTGITEIRSHYFQYTGQNSWRDPYRNNSGPTFLNNNYRISKKKNFFSSCRRNLMIIQFVLNIPSIITVTAALLRHK